MIMDRASNAIWNDVKDLSWILKIVSTIVLMCSGILVGFSIILVLDFFNADIKGDTFAANFVLAIKWLVYSLTCFLLSGLVLQSFRVLEENEKQTFLIELAYLNQIEEYNEKRIDGDEFEQSMRYQPNTCPPEAARWYKGLFE